MSNPKKQNARAKPGACIDPAGGQESINQNSTTDSQSTTAGQILANKSTSTEVQLDKLLALLRSGPKTTVELRQHAIMMPAARVFQLRHEQNRTINTELVSLYDTEGVWHRKCARYHLVEQVPAQASFDFGGAQ
jgi:hypothetical protein